MENINEIAKVEGITAENTVAATSLEQPTTPTVQASLPTDQPTAPTVQISLPADQPTAPAAPDEDTPKKGKSKRTANSKAEKAPKLKKPPKEKKPKASEMTLEELAETELVHAKITVSEGQKNEYAPLLGFIGQRFASRRELQEAGLEIAIMYYTETEKGKGIIQRVEGQITMFDSTTQVIGIDGNKYKLNCTYTIEALNFDPFDEDAVFEPQRQDEDEDENEEPEEDGEDYGSNDERADDEEHSDYEYRDRNRERSCERSSYNSKEEFYYVEDEDGFTLRLTASQYKEMERIQDALRKQMERDMEKMREQQRRELAKKYGSNIDEDGFYADEDSGYWPDERPPREKGEDSCSSSDSSSSKKTSRGPKTIGWLPPAKRKLEMHDKKKKSKASKKGDEGGSAETGSGGK